MLLLEVKDSLVAELIFNFDKLNITERLQHIIIQVNKSIVSFFNLYIHATCIWFLPYCLVCLFVSLHFKLLPRLSNSDDHENLKPTHADQTDNIMKPCIINKNVEQSQNILHEISMTVKKYEDQTFHWSSSAEWIKKLFQLCLRKRVQNVVGSRCSVTQTSPASLLTIDIFIHSNMSGPV